MSLLEFLCGGLSALRSRRTTAYQIGGDVRIVTTSSSRTLPGRKRVSPAKPDNRRDSNTGVEMVEGSWSPGSGSYYLPYSMGNPLINLGFNILLRGLEQAGLLPEEEALPYD